MELFGGALHFFSNHSHQIPTFADSLSWQMVWPLILKRPERQNFTFLLLTLPCPLLPHAASNLFPFMPLLVSVKSYLCFHLRQTPCTHVLDSYTSLSAILSHLSLLFSPISTISTCKYLRLSPKTGTSSLSLLVVSLFQLCLSTF